MLDLIYKRLARPHRPPSLGLTASLSALGLLMAAGVLEAPFRTWASLNGFYWLPDALALGGGCLALLMVAGVGAQAGLLVASEVQGGQLTTLKMANVPARALIWGYLQAALFRGRVFIGAYLITLPLLASAALNLADTLYADIYFASNAGPYAPPPHVPSWSLDYNPMFSLTGALAACAVLGGLTGFALALQHKESVYAAAGGSLVAFGLSVIVSLAFISGVALLSGTDWAAFLALAVPLGLMLSVFVLAKSIEKRL